MGAAAPLQLGRSLPVIVACDTSSEFVLDEFAGMLPAYDTGMVLSNP